MSFRRVFFKNVLTVGGYTYAVQLIAFFSSTITSRLILPSEYGFIALITVFTGFISIFTDAGFSAAVIRGDYGQTYYRALKNLTFHVGVFLFLMMCVVAYPIALFYGDLKLILPTIVLSSLFIIKPLSIVPSAILRKNLQFNTLGRRDVLATVIGALLTILFAYSGFSYWALILPQLIVAFLTYLFIEREVNLGYKIYPYQHSIVAFRMTKSLIGNVLGFSLINYWARNVDNLLVGKIYGADELGIYNRAYMLLTLPLNLISGLFGSILFPSLKKMMSDGGDLKKEYEHILGIISLINYPVAIILILFPEFLVGILWGENWMKVAEILPYFGLLVLSQGLITTIGSIFIILRKERANFVIGSINAVILVIAIAIGASYSVLSLAKFYTAAYIFINVPINLYYGFIKSFGFDWSFIFRFWLPKILLSSFILVGLWIGQVNITYLASFVYGFHLIYLQRNEIIGFATMVLKRYKKV